MNTITKIAFGLLAVVIIVLLGAIIYLLLQTRGQNSVISGTERHVGRNFSIKEGGADHQRGQLVAKDNMKNRHVDTVTPNTSDKKITFDTGWLQIKNVQNIPLVNDVQDEFFMEFNHPSKVSYQFKSMIDYDTEYTVLDIFNLEPDIKQVRDGFYKKIFKEVSDVLLNNNVDIAKFNNANKLMLPTNAGCTPPQNIKKITTPFMTGVRFVTYCNQEYVPIPKDGAVYVFQGISKDGNKHIYFETLNVKILPLEKYYANNPKAENDLNDNNIEKTYKIFKDAKDDDFFPELKRFDSFIKSIRYQ